MGVSAVYISNVTFKVKTIEINYDCYEVDPKSSDILEINLYK